MKLTDTSILKIGQNLGMIEKEVPLETEGSVGQYLDEAELSSIVEDLSDKKEKIVSLLDSMLWVGSELRGLGNTYQELEKLVTQAKELITSGLDEITQKLG